MAEAPSVAAFLRALKARDIEVRLEGENLRLNAPKGVLTPELKSELGRRKSEIIRFLADRATPSGGPMPGGPIETVPRDGELPLSFAQQSLWFLDKLDPKSAFYNIFDGIHIRGPLRVELLHQAFERVSARHEILRAAFPSVGGRPRLEIAPPGAGGPLLHVDLLRLEGKAREAARHRLVARAARRPMDLASGPLARFLVLRLAAEELLLIITVHHIVADAWSMTVLMREVFEIYEAEVEGRAAALPELPIQYADYAAWQRRRLQGRHYDEQVAFWRRQLAGAPTLLELPTDRPRPSAQSFRGALEPVAIPPSLSRALEESSRRQGTTLLVTLAAAFHALLYRYTAQRSILLGLAVAGRNRAELENLIGLFVNTLILRADLSGAQSFADLRAEIHATMAEAQAHQELPFERLVDELGVERSLSHSPLFQVALVMQNLTVPRLTKAGLELESVEVHTETTKNDLTLLIRRGEAGLHGAIEYSTDLFDVTTIRRFGGHLRQLFEAVADDPKVALGRLAILPRAERHQVLREFNPTAPPAGEAKSEERTIHRLIATVAARRPDAPALIFAGRTTSYGELLFAARRLARRLRAAGVAAGSTVAVATPRSADMIIGILGVLEAGAAYVPIDPAYPSERIDAALADCGAEIVLSSAGARLKLGRAGVRELRIEEKLAGHDAPRDVVADEPVADVELDDLAYLIYTSGSTGGPKGVMVSHRTLLRSTVARRAVYRRPVGRFLLLPSFAFDSSVAVIFWTLVDGGALVIPEEGAQRDAARLGELLIRHRVTHLLALPALYQTLLATGEESRGDCYPDLETVIVAGEATHWDLVALDLELRGGRGLYNEYGPTEGTVWSTVHRFERVEAPRRVPIGRPIGEVRVILCSPLLEPVPIGAPGEICLGGGQLARGSLGRPAATAACFVPQPVAARPGERLYRTGDLGRWRVDARLEFLGRVDQQVKIRGYRIELGEIEESLQVHPAVARAAVVVDEAGPGQGARLAAWVELEESTAPETVAGLRRHLEQRLPHYMVPARLEILDALPVGPTGKIDRRALARRGGGGVQERAFTAPGSRAERQLAAIWSRVLRREKIGAHDNFFHLGGDSILSIQVVAQAAAAGLSITAQDVFEHQTLAALALRAASRPTSGRRREEPRPSGEAPLTPIQHWFFDQRLAEPWHWNQALWLELGEEIEPDRLRRALALLVDHHDATRLRFHYADTGWRQVYEEIAESRARAFDGSFLHLDLSREGLDPRSLARAQAARLQAGFDLARGPLFRALLVDPGGGRASRLLLAAHHLVIDAASWRVLLEDLDHLYRQLGDPDRPRLAPRTSSYKRWGECLLEHARSEELRREAAWWASRAPISFELPRDFAAVDARYANRASAAEKVTVFLGSRETRRLQGELGSRYRARIDELLLAALGAAMSRWLTENGGEQRGLWLDLEGHGRAPELAAELDLSRTVGWFTALFPLWLDGGDSADVLAWLQEAKRRLREIPHGGVGFGVARRLGPAAGLEPFRLPAREVLFNYLGRIDSADGHVGQDGGGEEAGEPRRWFRLEAASPGPVKSPRGRRCHLLEINASLFDERLRIEWEYSRDVHRRATVERLAEDQLAALRVLLAADRESASEVMRRSLVPADFPLAGLTASALEHLLLEHGEVEDIYPLSPLQEGMLFHLLYDETAGEYLVQMSCVIDDLDVAAFRTAWERVVDRHPVLRTAFAWEGLDAPLQVVLPAVELPFEEEDWRNLEPRQQADRLESLLLADRRRGFDFHRAPLVRFTLIRVADASYRFIWTSHHMILDGWSLPLIVRELFDFYVAACRGRGAALPPAPLYRDYIAWLERLDESAAEAYWQRRLAGLREPTPLGLDRRAPTAAGKGQLEVACGLEATAALTAFGRRHGLTVGTLLQGAWALLLRHYSGRDDVLFGLAVSGRPPALAGADSIVGLFLNTVAIRVRISGEARLVPWLHQLQDEQARALEHSWTPLSVAQKLSEIAPPQPLFESFLNFESYPVDEALRSEKFPLAMRDFRVVETATFPLNLVVTPGENLRLELKYSRERFEEAAIRRIGRDFITMLGHFPASADAELATLDVRLAEAHRASARQSKEKFKAARQRLLENRGRGGRAGSGKEQER